MARWFTGSTSSYLRAGAAPVTVVPITMFARVYPVVPGFIFSICASSDPNQWWAMTYGAAGFGFNSNGGAPFIGGTAAPIPIPGKWYNVVIQYITLSSQAIFFSQGTGAFIKQTFSATQTRNPSSLDSMYIGMLGRDLTHASDPFTGAIADVGVWNVALTDGEVNALATIKDPRNIRRSALQGFWPCNGNMGGTEQDTATVTNNMTVNAAALISGPPIIAQQTLKTSAAAGFNPYWAIGRNQFIEGFAS